MLNELISLKADRYIDCAFCPHIGLDSSRLKLLVEQQGLAYISPADLYEKVIDFVKRSKRLICSAMHGAILTEALRVPLYPATTSPEILHFKWQNWFQSIALVKELHPLPTIWPHG